MSEKSAPADNTVSAAVESIAEWIRDPAANPRPARSELAHAVRTTARALAARAPGHSVELRIPPFVAVQCIEGPRHTRGSPPNVVECSVYTWLALVSGEIAFDEALTGTDLSASGSRAHEIAAHLPLTRLDA